MREIYLVEKTSRLRHILASDLDQNDAEMSAIGIGFFNCQKNGSGASEQGVAFRTSPAGLRTELLHEILAGRHSPLSQDILLLGTPAAAAMDSKQKERNKLWKRRPESNHSSNAVASHAGSDRSSFDGQSDGSEFLLQRWLVVGLQCLSDLVSQNVTLTDMNLKILEARTLSSAVDTLLTGLFARIADIRTSTVVFQIDSSILVDFFFTNLGRVPFGLGLSDARLGNLADLSVVEREICTHRVAEEVVRWVALNGLEQLVVLKCEKQRHLSGLSSICRMICTSKLNRGIAFRF